MATISGNVCNTYIHMDLIVTETATSIDDNTSTLAWKLVGYMGSGGTSSYWYSNSYHTISVVINGITVYSLANTIQKNISIGTDTSASNPRTIAEGTTTVAHSADGTKTCACSFSCVYRYNSAYTWTGSGNVALTTLPRATTPTLSAATTEMGKSVTINCPRASSSFTHTLKYIFGKTGGVIATGVTTSCAWAIPLDLANQIPSDVTGYGYIHCDTYNGNTLVGTKAVRFGTTVPESVVPTITSITLSDPEGHATTFGGYVQSKSKIKVQVVSSGAYSSTITKTEITVAGITTTVNPYTSNVITESGGTKTVSIKITDSRGRTASRSLNYSVLSYESPTIDYLTASRCNADGSANDEGAYVKISYEGSITSLNNKNSISHRVEYKSQDSDTWMFVDSSDEDYHFEDYQIKTADINKTYDVRYTVTDSFSSTEKTWQVSTAFTLMDFNSSGKGIAFGKVSESDELEVNMPLVQMKNVVNATLNSATGWSTQVAYPDGFNSENTLPILCVYYTNSWRNGTGIAGNTVRRTFVEANATGIRVYNNDPNIYGLDVKIILFKY